MTGFPATGDARTDVRAAAPDAAAPAGRERIVIGTRGSALALWQAHAVEGAVKAAFPQLQVEVRVITTQGDLVLDKPLAAIGDKGLFTKELEHELLNGEVDICVHSMKDVPSELPAGCVIGAMLPRADVRDVLVCGPRIAGCRSLSEVPGGSRVGTGSLRRTAQLVRCNPGLVPTPIRGNVDTRIAKAQGDGYEGVILAAAGVARMDAQDKVSAYIPVEDMLPAVGQGAIGLEVRADDADAARVCAAVNDAPTFACVMAERTVLKALEGGCQVPLGAYARYEADNLRFDAAVFSLDGSREARSRGVWPAYVDPLAAAAEMVEMLRAQGADALLEEARLAGDAL